MNKYLSVLALFLGILVSAQAQNGGIRFNLYTNFMTVNSYAGNTQNDMVNTEIWAQRSQGSQMKNWTMSFRIVGPISNGSMTISQEDLPHFKLQVVRVVGGWNPNENNMYATLGNIGAITAPIPFSYSDSYLVPPYSSFSLHNNNSYDVEVKLFYRLIVEGGAYLEKYKSWSNYQATVLVEVRNAKNDLIVSQSRSFGMQIHPEGNPPGPTNSLTINPNATNVLMEFKTPGDYVNGVSAEKLNAISVESSSAYVLEVRSLSSELTSPSSTLPISTVQLQMRRSSTQQITGTANLSTAAQTLLSSTAHSDTRNFDLLYKTTPPSIGSGFFNKPYETYSGTIVFSLTPQ